ncbi:MAG TPA: hypothetical protein VME44_17570, partial [Streptosporangiaceae bacterium]|nr:hypothetical protein [Streptosporangiaceae bacterium]
RPPRSLQRGQAGPDRVLRRAVTALAPGSVLLVAGHEVTNLTEGTGARRTRPCLPSARLPAHSGTSPQ